MRLVVVLTGLALCLCACVQIESDENDAIGVVEEAVVYGDDDRTEVYAHSDSNLRDLARFSTLALIRPSAIDSSDPTDVRINAASLEDSYGLCSDQRFLEQPTAAMCSATLIDTDLVLTAGHCATNLSECQSFQYVFNYYYEAAGDLATITTDDIYQCQALVVQRLAGGHDYAIIQLDRPVAAPHRPAPVFLADEALEDSAPVTVIGFGSGIPAKIDDGGHVIDGRPGTLDYFVATTDTFGGNSGSGTYNAAGQVVGILVRGETDYVSEGGCYVVNELPADPGPSSGEDITYVARALEHLCEDEGWPSPTLCGGPSGEGWCDPCETAGNCPDTWTCSGWPAAPSITFCSAPCSSPDECRSDHECVGGRCQPRVTERCRDDDVWTIDGCGRSITLVDNCSSEQSCRDGVCVDVGAGDTCSSPIAIDPVSQTLTGDMTLEYAGDYRGSCAGGGPEAVFQFSVDEEVRLWARADGYDTVLYLRSSCNDSGSEVTCNDDTFGLSASIASVLSPGTYFLFLDAYSTTVGNYTLQIDFTDPGETLEGDTCANPTEIEAVSQTLTGNMAGGYYGDYRGSCAGGGPERVYQFTLGEDARLFARADGYDTVLYLRGTCDASSTEVACNDDTFGLSASLDVEIDAGEYFLFLDAYSGSVGEFTLDLDFEILCDDLCTLSNRRCSDNDAELCMVQANGCTDWSVLETCVGSEVCLDGFCESVCTDECRPTGVRQCADLSQYEVCGSYDDDPCLEWGATTSCPPDRSCQLGICVEGCVDECPGNGEIECATDNATHQCRISADGCLIWGANIMCDPGQHCEGDRCVAGCVDTCTVAGQQRCMGTNGVQTCDDFNGDGCIEWGVAEICPDEQTCADGICVDGCVDTCAPAEQRCVDETTQINCQLGESGCYDWSELVACPVGWVCLENLCRPNIDPCEDECLPVGLHECVTERSIRTCGDFDTDVCSDWGPEVMCDDEEHCTPDVLCTPTCPTDCEIGVSRCQDDGVQFCVDLGDGCSTWGEITPCEGDQVCGPEGICIGQCEDDGYEPNDTHEQALYLAPDVYLDMIVCNENDDWYGLDLQPGEMLVVRVRSQFPEMANLDLELFEADLSEVVDTSYGSSSIEEVTVVVEEPTSLVWHIYLDEGDVDIYDMVVGAGEPPIEVCLPDERRCHPDGFGYQICEAFDDTWAWSDPIDCEPGYQCAGDGECEPVSFGPVWDFDVNPDARSVTPQISEQSPPSDEGCGCRTAKPVPVAWPWVLVVLVFVGRRGRKR